MTLLFYVDESRDKRHEFHAGVLVTGRAAATAEAHLEEVVASFSGQRACEWRAELHGYDIFQRCGPWGNATPDQAAHALAEALEVLVLDEIEVIARGVELPSFEARYGDSDPYRWEFSNLLERLNERLTERDAYGLVIADDHHRKSLLQRDVDHGKRHGTGGYRSQQLRRVLDTAHFVDSERSRMTQLADLVNFVLRRRESIPEEADPRAERVMRELAEAVHGAVPTPHGQYYTVRR